MPGSARRKRWRPWRNLLIALLAVNLFQYFKDGSVSWPRDVLETARESLGQYAGRPQASWRKAADELEELGAAREGQPIPAFGLRGRVVRVADGDTISVLDQSNRQHKIRLHGIDTPEREQRYGNTARAALADMIADETVGVVVLGTDSYGRTDGTVYLGERNINLAMVAGGHAWWYRYYEPNNPPLEAAETEARAKKRGLWAQPNPTPPWDWRRQQRYGK